MGRGELLACVIGGVALSACGSGGGSEDGSGGSAGSGGGSAATGGGAGATGGSAGAGGSAGSSGTGGSAGGGGNAGSAGAPAEMEVTIDSGPIRGAEDGETWAYKGIPYAAPPTGDNRWKPPQAVSPWTDVLDASATRPICPQDPALAGMEAIDEDCLFLNVWTPKNASGPLPVMVWIHGGAFVFGSGSGPAYDGHLLADVGNVVVVTVNYRLGPLGFFAHSALTAENGGSSGNQGLEDQVAALEWVQRNIAIFNGDPDNVTIFGESAGGNSACQLMASPLATGLFHRAISQSGLCTGPLLRWTLADGESGGQRIADAVGCTDPQAALACLRGKSFDELAAATASLVGIGGPLYQPRSETETFPIVDGRVIPKRLAEALAADEFEHVPLLLGTNADEGTLFHSGLFMDTPVTNETEYREALGRAFGTANVDTIVAEYPVSSFASPNDALIEVSTDAYFACPARRTARLVSDAGVATYLYFFNREPESAIPNLGVFHSGEIGFVFGVPGGLGNPAMGDGPLVDAVQGYWTRFAATGDPNGSGAETWPAYTTATDQHLALDLPIATGANHKQAKCDVWDTIQ